MDYGGNSGHQKRYPNQYLNTAAAEYLTAYTSNPVEARRNNIVNRKNMIRDISRTSRTFDIKIKLPVYKVKDVSTNVSRVNDIIQKYSLNKNPVINEPYVCQDKIGINDNNRSKQNEVDNDIQYIHTTRSFLSNSVIDPVNVKEKDNTIEQEPLYESIYSNNYCATLNNEGNITVEAELTDAVSQPDPNRMEYAEKTTYCRPILNVDYDKFTCKTLERKTRLQRLLKRVIVSRQRAKGREMWNNYVNELKNRHRFQFGSQNNDAVHKINNKLLGDLYTTEFMLANQYNQYQNLLEDLCESYDSAQPNYSCYGDIYKNTELRSLPRSYFNQSNPYCYPTSSQRCCKILNIEKEKNVFSEQKHNELSVKNKRRSDTIICEKELNYKGCNKNRTHFKKVLFSNYPVKNILLKTCSMQTDLTISPLINAKINMENFVTGTINDNIIKSNYKYTDFISLPVNKRNENECKSEIEKLKKNILNNISVQTDIVAQCVTNEIKNENQERTTKESSIMNSFMQTDFTPISTRMKENEIENSIKKRDVIKENYTKVSDNVKRLRKRIYGSEDNIKKNSLAAIEMKIDNLMQTIDTFIDEIKNRKLINRKNKDKSVNNNFSKLNEYRPDKIRSDTVRRSEKEQFYTSGFIDQESSANIMNTSEKVNEILIEELNKSNKIKKDINGLLNMAISHPYAFKTIFDAPTKERFTEVSASLSKTKASEDQSIIIEKVSTPVVAVPHTHMTIAVNTDPVGVLTLLRISKDTIRRLVLYIWGIDYSQYLSKLQLSSNALSNYVCNVCGAVFLKSSQLTDHIQRHSLGDTRDCCVCRHILDMRRSLPGPHSCQYCGRRFIRAYCCELHEKSCAQRFGKQHDVKSSHIFLK